MVEIYAPKLEQKYDFNAGFKVCCRTLRKHVRDDWDAVLAITGKEGVSKSTCANWIGFKADKGYTLEKNVLYSPNEKEMVEAIKKLPRFGAVNGDEAIKVLYKQRWWLQSFINMFYRLCRQENKITILCMPRFSEFNEGFRNHRIQIWIHLLDRGLGIAFTKDWNPFVKDPWHTDENERMVKKYTKGQKLYQMTLERKISILKRSKNFLDVVTFPDLPEDIRIRYKELAASHKYEGMDAEMTRRGRTNKIVAKLKEDRKFLKDEYKKSTGKSDAQIAQMRGVSRPTITGW